MLRENNLHKVWSSDHPCPCPNILAPWILIGCVKSTMCENLFSPTAILVTHSFMLLQHAYKEVIFGFSPNPDCQSKSIKMWGFPIIYPFCEWRNLFRKGDTSREPCCFLRKIILVSSDNTCLNNTNT